MQYKINAYLYLLFYLFVTTALFVGGTVNFAFIVFIILTSETALSHQSKLTDSMITFHLLHCAL